MYVIDCVDCSVFSVHVSCVYADLSESHNSRAIGDTTVWMEELLLIMCTRMCKRPSSGISQSHLCPHDVGGLLLSPTTPVLLCVVAVEGKGWLRFSTVRLPSGTQVLLYL